MGSTEKLRDNINALQGSLRDISKWKIVLTGSVAALGLGLTGSATPNAYLSIGAIPFIVVYCDLLICDCDLRTGVISTYLRTDKDSEYSRYENFLRSEEIKRIRWWDFSHIATQLSSYIACIFVLSIAIAHAILKFSNDGPYWIFLVIISILGIIVVNWIQRTYNKKYYELFNLQKQRILNPLEGSPDV